LEEENCMRRIMKIAASLGIGLVFLLTGIFPLPTAAQLRKAELLLEKPQSSTELPGSGEKKKEVAPITCGPLISDSCIPIEEHHGSLQVLWAHSLVINNFGPNWLKVDAGGNFSAFQLQVKFTYGPVQDVETFIIVPFIAGFANSADIPGPNGERYASYASIGDITAVVKYLLLEEGNARPAVTILGGVGWPSGHASRLNPKLLLQDAIGTGSFNFITGVNLYKWVKPFLLYSNIWLNSPINVFPLRGSEVPQNVRNRENVIFNLAAEYPINQQWVLLLEMYSNWAWSNPGTESLGFQSPTTLLGFLPGIEYLLNDKWALTAGCAFDTIGKFGTQKITPTFTVYYNF
jgi:hypothetical protein